MSWTLLHWTSNKIWNIKRIQSCSFVDDRTRTPEFWLRMNKHRTSNLLKRPSQHFSNIKCTRTCSSFSNWTKNALYMASNDQTLNFKQSSTHHYQFPLNFENPYLSQKLNPKPSPTSMSTATSTSIFAKISSRRSFI